jgi:7-carboxy-7-deazaguanine synthase
MKPLPVYETFYSWQGEGCHMGKSAFFIRLFGCPIKCPWCDSAGTWHPDFVPETIERISVEALVAQAKEHNPAIVVITGGEPCIHDLTELTHALQEADLTVNLETAGAYPIRGSFDWITLSPKEWKHPLNENLALAHEFKVIVDKPETIEFWETTLGDQLSKRPVWLNPEWSQRADPLILRTINSAVKKGQHDYRAGYQLHKLFAVDEEDSRSKPTTQLRLSPSDT